MIWEGSFDIENDVYDSKEFNMKLIKYSKLYVSVKRFEKLNGNPDVKKIEEEVNYEEDDDKDEDTRDEQIEELTGKSFICSRIYPTKDLYPSKQEITKEDIQHFYKQKELFCEITKKEYMIKRNEYFKDDKNKEVKKFVMRKIISTNNIKRFSLTIYTVRDNGVETIYN